MPEPIDVTTVPIHLGLGAKATTLTDFGWSPEQLAANEEGFASDGAEGRLGMMGWQDADWPTWEPIPPAKTSWRCSPVEPT